MFTPTDWLYVPAVFGGGARAITLVRRVAGLEKLTHVTHAGDGSGRLFVTEKAGRIRLVKDGALSPTPFLAIEDRVGSSGREQGLLSVAFPPGYGSKAFFYVDYTDCRFFLHSDLRITSFGEDEQGNLYVVDFRDGMIYEVNEAR